MSPSYDQYYEASKISQEKLKPKGKLSFDINDIEHHNQINLSTISSVIVGAQQQALSFRREVQDNDYPNQFYKEYLLHDELFDKMLDENLPEDRRVVEHTKHVLMDRSYLQAWQLYLHEAKQISPKLLEMISHERDLEGSLRAFRALSALKLDAH